MMRHFVILFISSLVILPLFAQKQYSLEECYKLALGRNITVKQAENNISAAIIDRKTAQNTALPSITYSIGHYFSFGKNIDPVTNAFVYERFSGGYTALGLQLNLFSGFSRVNAVKQSTYLIQASEYGKKRTELELLTNVTLTYARLLFDREQLAVQRTNLQNAERELEIINEKINVGRLTKYEFYTFNSRFNIDKANLVTIQNDSVAALQDLKQLLNLSKEEFDIASIDTAALSEIYTTTINETELMQTVLHRHPAIKEAHMNEQAAQLGVKIARSNALPSLSLGGNIASNYNANQRNNNGSKIPLGTQLNNNLGQNINIGLHIPLFSQMQNTNMIRRERINIANAQLAIQEAENAVVTNTLQLINDFNAVKQRYVATSSAWEQSSLSYSMYDEKYRLGQASSLELLTAREALNSATSKYIQAKLELYFQYQLLELLKNDIDMLYVVDENNRRREALKNMPKAGAQPQTPGVNKAEAANPEEKKTENIKEPERATIQALLSNMTLIKGGSYTMGNNKAPAPDESEHPVSVNSLLFGKYEVTQQQWESIMGYNPSLNKGCSTCPVENVSWEEVMKFIRKLNVLSNKKFRLPTEAEWEYVARMGGKTEIDKAGGQEEYIKRTAWYYGNSDKKTHPVGQKQPNIAGIYDIMGNVSEWCADWYSADYYKEENNQKNPEGPPLGKEKVVRGGSYNEYSGDHFRPSLRNKLKPSNKSGGIGFRLVMEAD
ncbi:MAG: TolC family protein [Bacteroidota bacterium]|nr:TolC family protein [Flavisolibacter sp.]MBD0284069.1 TolC family protein [Flavisolibacter sp.]MBD0349647.1 TolC family protein [Flavisolibacter sp.]MBD0365260.1 TolC family protein [Flavisolibacter sp.]MDQ3845573.1 TolC family protein [Bacteroidota bacterium]